MSHNILKIFNSIYTLTEDEITSLLEIMEEKHLKKGELWMHEGTPNHNIAFVTKGFLRKFYLKDGNEQTDSFYFENEFCADLPSILSKQNPDSFVMAMRTTDLITIPFSKYQQLCAKFYAFEHIYRVLLEQTFLRFYNRTRSFVELTPKERYEMLLNSEPKILLNATQYHIASYIGISHQHLSRLRGKK